MKPRRTAAANEVVGCCGRTLVPLALRCVLKRALICSSRVHKTHQSAFSRSALNTCLPQPHVLLCFMLSQHYGIEQALRGFFPKTRQEREEGKAIQHDNEPVISVINQHMLGANFEFQIAVSEFEKVKLAFAKLLRRFTRLQLH